MTDRATTMFRVTFSLQLLLVVLILRQSAAISDQCSKQQDEISRLERDTVCQDLLKAAKYGDVNTANILFKCSNDKCTDDDRYRNTPLTYAARYGYVEVVRVLLEGGANVDRANVVRSTALHLAGGYGRLDVCRLLLDWGAKVDALNRWKNTPLHYAAQWGHLSVVKLFVERGADVSVKGYGGRNASDMARNWGHKAVSDWLDSVTRG